MARGRKNERELKKTTIRLHVDTLDMLRKYYPSSGYNEVLRALSDRHVRKLLAATGTEIQDTIQELLTTEELGGGTIS